MNYDFPFVLPDYYPEVRHLSHHHSVISYLRPEFCPGACSPSGYQWPEEN